MIPYNFEEYVFAIHDEALEALVELNHRVSEKGHATVADYYDLVGADDKTMYQDTMHGWSAEVISNASVVTHRDVLYIITLPKAEAI